MYMGCNAEKQMYYTHKIPHYLYMYMGCNGNGDDTELYGLHSLLIHVYGLQHKGEKGALRLARLTTYTCIWVATAIYSSK